MGLVEPAEARIVHYEEGPDAGRWRVELWQEGQLGAKCVGQSSTFDNEIQCAVYVKRNYPHLLGDEVASLIPPDPEPESDETEAVGAPEPPKGRKPREPKDG